MTTAEAVALGEAMVAGGWPQCTCGIQSGLKRTCPGHLWLQEIDRVCNRTDKLLFYRSLRDHFIAGEGLTRWPTPPVDTRGKLPW